ncbi:MAG: hypoxanthine phosphoribosyltransferase [Thermoguttaceae bacterium]|nr:hypoxanthine phosphoribosyltransferase [Thermoguttaceae bacterium]MDW8079758.1 hypoxanthine phosphoribosyltransferase [Thermoguttaceae bacterium]
MKVLLSEEQVRAGVQELARRIEDYYRDKPLTMVGVLIGSIVLLADLIRQISIPLRVELVQARRYWGQARRPGPLAVDLEVLAAAVRGRHVLLVDDIFDTGQTIAELIPMLDELGPASVRTAVLLRKQGRSQVDFQPDFVAFDIPDVFVVGYGLDYNDMYRNLPYVAALEPEELAG